MSISHRMAVGLNVLEHLGFDLYGNSAAVLIEEVANAWAAYASGCRSRRPHIDHVEE
jgi:hypothetical protein